MTTAYVLAPFFLFFDESKSNNDNKKGAYLLIKVEKINDNNDICTKEESELKLN